MDYIIDIIGNKYWYKDGKHHREDGPAIEFANGDKAWYKEGLHHREDGPAIDSINGSKWWIIQGKIHRVDGPAIEYADGDKLYYYLDKRIECSSDEEYFKLLKLKAFW